MVTEAQKALNQAEFIQQQINNLLDQIEGMSLNAPKRKALENLVAIYTTELGELMMYGMEG